MATAEAAAILLECDTRALRRGGTVDHPKPRLRYLDAGNVQDQTLDVDGMKVRNADDETLGNVDGFIVDSDSGRPYYIVVNAGGWFKSRHFLLPIGQAHLDGDRDALVVKLSKAQVQRFPGFDLNDFEKLTDADIKRINDGICVVFEETIEYRADEPYPVAWDRPSYRKPDWWGGETREREDADDRHLPIAERAHPGDVIGIATGGERTYVGDTKESEEARLDAAEATVRQSRN
jgi:hypothetical protein